MEEKQLLDKLWDNYELSHEAARQQRIEIESTQKAGRRIAELKKGISALGSVNVGAIEEFQRVNERYTYLTDQRNDVDKAKKELEDIIGAITGEMKTIFAREFKVINEAFGKTFTELFGGGKAHLELSDPEDVLNSGIVILAQPPGKIVKILKSNTTYVWTLDDTEPMLGQKDYVGKSDKYARYNGQPVEMQLRGTITSASKSKVYQKELLDHNPYAAWVKVYQGKSLIFEGCGVRYEY
jgi:hypothetical protein